MKDNRQYQREKIRQENSSSSSAETNRTATQRRQHDVIGSFDYAIRPDGEILSEFLWKQRRLEGKSFTFIDERPAIIGEQLSSSSSTISSDISLAKIETMIKNTSLRYEKLSSLPEEPTFIKPSFTSSLSSSLPSLNVTPPASLQQQQQQQQQNNQNQNSKENSYNMNSNNAKLPYNNMMNQQQPNSHHKQSYHPSANEQLSSTKPSAVSSSSGPANNFANHHNNNNNNNNKYNDDPIVQDDDYDDIIANLNVEEALSQHKKTTNSSHFESTKNNMYSGFDYGSNSGRDYSNGGGGGGNNNNNSTINNHGQQREPFRNSNYDSNSSSFNNQSSSNFNTSNNSSSVERSSYFESSSSSGRDTYATNNNNNSNNNNQSIIDNNPHGNNNNNNNGDGTPLCPGHSQPCRVFTANTSTNMGRQFFKCSLPEGQNCDFFQWKDGDVEENNWNDNNHNNNNVNNYSSSGSGSGTSGGNILDMYEENQRVFGHRTFRKGQQLVIEKAIQGKDVFVLMPTG